MRWIVRDAIAVGNFREAWDADLLAEERIRSILCLDGAMNEIRPGDVGVERIEIVLVRNGPDNRPGRLLRAIRTLADLERECSPVLVQDGVGAGPAVAIVMGYFIRMNRLDHEAARARVEKRRRRWLVDPELESAVVAAAPITLPEGDEEDRVGRAHARPGTMSPDA